MVSDHGTIDNKYDIRPNVVFANNGLISVDENGKIKDWDVWCQRSGGTGQIRLKDRDNKEVREKVESILKELVEDNESGVNEVITGKEAREIRKGFPDADYVLISEAGYEVKRRSSG